MPAAPQRTRSTTLALLLVWLAVYASFALVRPALLDDADSVHAEVAREMLVRHDWVTLYANGIRYLEKAPLMYWSMAASMKLASLFGFVSARAFAIAARIPIALGVLGLTFAVEAFARRLYSNARAGVYAALITLSSAGIFLFTRITLPDGFVCLWLALAMYALLRCEEDGNETPCNGLLFGLACALGVLSKGLIGLVFPLAIVVLYLLLAYGIRGAFTRANKLPWAVALLAFFAIATPWHVLIGLANPGAGHPAPFLFMNGHWHVPLPTDGNVRGWFWFYFMNEHLLRYLNLRVPHDYDTSPLYLFWGLCFVWLMPWSAFFFKSITNALPFRNAAWRARFRTHTLSLQERGTLLVVTWAGFVLLFFTLSTRQEYYILPALPAIGILIAGWLVREEASAPASRERRATTRCLVVVVALGSLFAIAAIALLFVAKAPPAGTDLATLLSQNPGDYALSMGHVLDLDTRAMGMFRTPLMLAILALFAAPMAALLLRRRAQTHASNLALASGALLFLIAAHLGLQTFAPVLTSAQLAERIAPLVQPNDLIVLHGEYEAGSTLGFYLQRNDLHILEGRSSNLWYGSFFPDAPRIFESPSTLAEKWPGSQRIFLWQSLTDPPNQLPALPGHVYVLAISGGKEIVSNQR
ncbi:glycosyltransferase family 39 protein [Granulicella cerasi]|uniref:Glycosyltransferase family 39 protein n=1 Tax=Granulicella cerasi TaxID=741063 RepID=A0ABW1ZCW5_9BACT|nr:glycosyltransferase family 39 protein [Granulicella cerasi]